MPRWAGVATGCHPKTQAGDVSTADTDTVPIIESTHRFLVAKLSTQKAFTARHEPRRGDTVCFDNYNLFQMQLQQQLECVLRFSAIFILRWSNVTPLIGADQVRPEYGRDPQT